MSRGKYLSLEEARKLGKLDQFVREHDIEPDTPNSRGRFDVLLGKMAAGKPSTADRTSTRETSED